MGLKPKIWPNCHLHWEKLHGTSSFSPFRYRLVPRTTHYYVTAMWVFTRNFPPIQNKSLKRVGVPLDIQRPCTPTMVHDVAYVPSASAHVRAPNALRCPQRPTQPDFWWNTMLYGGSQKPCRHPWRKCLACRCMQCALWEAICDILFLYFYWKVQYSYF